MFAELLLAENFICSIEFSGYFGFVNRNLLGLFKA